MNPDSPIDPRSALESTLTALLLGELPHDQAAALHQKLAQDPELAALYERLKHTISLVRETVSSPAQETADQPAPLRLSEDRRQKLLQQFKTVAPREFTRRRRSWAPALLQLSIAAAALVLLLASLLLPSFSGAKSKSMLSLSMSSLSKPLGSAAQPPSSTWSARGENRRTERFTPADNESIAGKVTAPLAQPVRAPVASAATAIVLPKGGEPADAATVSAFRRRYDWLPEPAPVATGAPAKAPSGTSGEAAASERAYDSHNSAPQDVYNNLQELFQRSNARQQNKDQNAMLGPSDPLYRHETGNTQPAPGGTIAGLGGTGGGSGRNQRQYPSNSTLGDAYFSIEPGKTVKNDGQIKAQGGTPPPTTSKPATQAKTQAPPLKDVELARSDSSQHQKQGNVGVADGSVDVLSLGLSKKAPEAPVTGDNLKLFDDQKAAKETTPKITLQGITALTGPKESPFGPVTDYFDRTHTAGRFGGEGDYTRSVTQPASPALGYDTYAAANNDLPVSTNSDADRVPLLGGSPMLGRLFRLQAEEAGVGGKVKADEKANDVAFAAKAGQESPKGTAGRAGSGPSNIYSFNVVGYYNLTAGPSQQVHLGEQFKTAGKSVLQDSGAADQRSRQLIAAKRDSEATQSMKEKPTDQSDLAPPKPTAPAPAPQPEVQTTDSAFSTFSLNVSDVSFKLAAASLEKGVMPEPGTVRSEEFINAFDYRDPEPPPGVPVAFAWERAQYPFAQNRDLLRFSIKTAAQGRQPGRPMNIVLLLDTSGSMERADRVQIIREALRVLAGQLQPQDKFSVVTFARTARLWVDGVPGNQAAQVVEEVSGITPQGGTNLEDAMNLAYQTAQRHYLANGINRVVLLTDGAANLGDVAPETLKQKVESNRKQGIALDCFGIGWEGFNDDLLEVLSRNGDGRYGFINTPEEAATGFAAQIAGALQVAASDVKVQVEFNLARVTAYRQIGYAKHQLTKEQFRDNTVAAAQIGAAESGNALYVIAVNPAGAGPLATVRVRYRVPGTSDVHEHEWPVPYTGNAVPLDQSTPAMRLAATASAFSEWLVSSPYATEVTPDRLLGYVNGIPEVYGADPRPRKLEWMLRQAKSLAGK